jgi:hypothetical protein
MNSRLILSSVLVSASISLILTFASYFCYIQPFTVDASFLYRGWPLYWMTESWTLWNPPPEPYRVSFQPVNFLIDLMFYAVLIQIPMQLYLRSRRKEATLLTAAFGKEDRVV